MSYNLVDPTTGDLTRVAGSMDTSIIPSDASASNKLVTEDKVNASLDELENVPRLFDFDEAIPEKGKNKIYYVNKIIDTYKCAQWRVESMYYDVSELNQYRGVQKATAINGVDNIMLMREYYLDDNNVMLWGDWQQLATTDSTLKTIQLSGSVDCNTLTEPGLYTASAGAVIALTNVPINNQVELDGGFSVLVTKTNVDGVYYGMQMFIPYGSDSPFIRKSYYLNGQYWTPWEQLATMDKVVKDSRTAVEILYNNSTGAFLETDMNLTATRSGILKVSFNKKEPGNTLNININGIRKYEYPNWWGENLYETAYVPVNKGDNIRISSDISVEQDWYRIVNVLII